MQKAKSRLSQVKEVKTRYSPDNKAGSIQTNKNKKYLTPVANSKKIKAPLKPLKPLFQNSALKTLAKKYLSHLATLILAIFFYYLIWLLMHQVYPAQIKNFIIINAYLPLALLFFLANFFAFSFLLLSSKKGFVLSLLLTLFLEIYLQKIWF